ncbi:MAG: hypothetical protein AAF585_09000 [Verrucomicrobiota bacterium]
MPSEPTFTTLHRTRAGAKRNHIPQKENEDRVLVREFTSTEIRREGVATLIAVADGVSRCTDGGGVADWLLEERLSKDVPFESANESIFNQFREYLTQVHRQFLGDFAGNADMLESGCTLCAVLVYGNRAAAYWAGDSPAYHFQFRKGQRLHTRTLTIADKDPFTGALTDCFSGLTPFAVKQGGFKINPGDIIITASDGLAFDGDDLITYLDQFGFTEEWVDEIFERSYNQPFSDDISVAALRFEQDEDSSESVKTQVLETVKP